MFLISDVGVYGDGALGHQNTREVLADLLEGQYRHHARGGKGSYWDEVSEVVDSLRGEMPDDAWDENEGLEWINRAAYDDTIFEWDSGDLVLTGPEDDEDEDED